MKAKVAVGWSGNPYVREEVIRSVEELLGCLAPATSLINKDCNIVVKPNITGDTRLWEKGIVTNPYVVEGVIRYLQKANPRSIVVAEATAVGLDTGLAFRENGYEEVASRTGVRLLDLNQDDFVSVAVNNGLVTKEIEIAKTVWEADLLINVPAMKTHFATGVSLGLKNLKGILPAGEKKRSHYLGVNKFVIDLNSVIGHALTVIDGSIGMEGDGPMGGKPVGFGCLVAGTDVLSTDLVAARLMGFDPWELKIFRLARMQKIGLYQENDIHICGIPPEKIGRKFQRAEGPLPYAPQVVIRDEDACSGCREGVRIALKRMESEDLLDLIPPLTVLLGSARYTGEESNVLSVGRCQKANRFLEHYVPGCPPQVFLITDQLREMIGKKRLFGDKIAYLFEEGDE